MEKRQFENFIIEATYEIQFIDNRKKDQFFVGQSMRVVCSESI